MFHLGKSVGTIRWIEAKSGSVMYFTFIFSRAPLYMLHRGVVSPCPPLRCNRWARVPFWSWLSRWSEMGEGAGGPLFIFARHFNTRIVINNNNNTNDTYLIIIVRINQWIYTLIFVLQWDGNVPGLLICKRIAVCRIVNDRGCWMQNVIYIDVDLNRRWTFIQTHWD